MPPNPANALLLIQRTLSRPPPQRHVSRRQLQQAIDQLFPQTVTAEGFSVGWQHALEVAILSRHCTPSSTSTTMAQPEKDVIEQMLNRGRFPVTAWHVPIRLLQRWRDLGCSSLDSHPQPPTVPQRFPPFQSLDAVKAMMQQLSFAQKGTTLRNDPWVEALQLYDETVRALADPHAGVVSPSHSSLPASRTNKRSGEDTDTSGLQKAATLKRVRHTLLTTLLDADRWQEAVRVFMHALYQRDMPGHITTGYLVQRLGERGEWKEVLRVYELCVRLVAARARVPGAAQRGEGRAWGTAFSLAMEAVGRHHPETVPDMVQRLVDASSSSPAAPSAGDETRPRAGVTQLDGHFLEAVQCVRSVQTRLDVLHLARQHNLLDFYKLIRGLVSRGRWTDALAMYCEAARSSPSGTTALTRKELGKSRLHLLHASSVENVERVVAVLQQVRSDLNGESTSRTSCPSLRLNDAEVECVLSKALQVNEHHTSSFWLFGLAVLQANYRELLPTDASQASTETHKHSAVRAPSVNALSLFFHDPHVPWQIALALAQHVNGHSDLHHSAVPHSTHAPPSSGPPAPVSGSTSPIRPETWTPSVSPSVLLWNAVAELLRRQGQDERGLALALSTIKRNGSSPSAGFLLRCPAHQLCDVLASIPALDGRVLYHLLHTTSPLPSHARTGFALERPGAASAAGVVAMKEADGTMWWVPKSFCIVSAWMTVTSGEEFLSDTPPTLSTHRSVSRSTEHSSPAETWFDCVPASVHCEVLKKLQHPSILAASQPDAKRCELIVRYLRCTLQPASPREPPPASEATSDIRSRPARHVGKANATVTTEKQSLQRLEKSYSVAFEAILALLCLLLPESADLTQPLSPTTVVGHPVLTASERVALACDVLSAVTKRAHYLPPTHLLLPQPLSRLLPRFRLLTACGDPSCADRVVLAGHLLRCCYVQLLPEGFSSVRQAQTPHHNCAPSHLTRLSQCREPAFYHALLKLCCRVAEYVSTWSQWRQDDGRPRGSPRRACPDAHELIVIGAHLIRQQEAACGLESIGEASLTLLYHLCAAAAAPTDKAASLPERHGTAPWEHALALTVHLASRQAEATVKAADKSGSHGEVPTHRAEAGARLSQRHWRTYRALFGWERGLSVWYRLLPETVLNDLSANADAVNHCLAQHDAEDTDRP